MRQGPETLPVQGPGGQNPGRGEGQVEQGASQLGLKGPEEKDPIPLSSFFDLGWPWAGFRYNGGYPEMSPKEKSES